MEKNSEMLKGYDSQIDKWGGDFGTPEQTMQLKKMILEKLQGEEMLYLSTISPAGWPETAVVHFTLDSDEESNPIFYVFTQPQFKKVENIQSNPRVSVSICHTPPPKKGDKDKKMWSFQFCALAKLLEDGSDRERADAIMKKKMGLAMAAMSKLMKKKMDAAKADMPQLAGKQPCIRIDPVLGTFSMPEGFGKPGSTPIDFTK